MPDRRHINMISGGSVSSRVDAWGGSGFLVSEQCPLCHPGAHLFLVTCNHVVWPWLHPDYTDGGPDTIQRALGLDLRAWTNTNRESYARIKDMRKRSAVERRRRPVELSLDLAGTEEADTDGVFVQHVGNYTESRAPASIDLAMLWTGDERYSDAYVGRTTYLGGYPDLPGRGFDGTRPIFTSGIIASDPLSSAGVEHQTEHSVLFQGFSWAGMSGGPVVAKHLEWRPDVGAGAPYLKPAIAGVSFGHIRAHQSAHSGWSGMFPSWIARKRIEELLAAIHTSPAADS